MDNDAYLILELDEHSAVAGVMTRIEAYKNVIENVMQKMRGERFEVEVISGKPNTPMAPFIQLSSWGRAANSLLREAI